jgi:DNA repair protein RadC
METLDQKIIRSVSEKMLREGSNALFDEEILALCLKSGDGVKDVLTLSKNLLKRYHTVNGICEVPVTRICGENRGITQAKALDIKAAMELGKRALSMRKPQVNVASPEDIVSFLAPELHAFDRECFKTVLLNTKNGLISVEDISVGTINASLVHAREVFRGAIAKNAFSLILVHNHPSGDPTPSENDIRITEQLKNAGEIIGIRVIDHIIIGNETFYSFQNESILF